MRYVAKRPVAECSDFKIKPERMPSQRLHKSAHVYVVVGKETIGGILVHVKNRLYATPCGRVAVAFNHDEESQPTVLCDGKRTNAYTLRLDKPREGRFGRF